MRDYGGCLLPGVAVGFVVWSFELSSFDKLSVFRVWYDWKIAKQPNVVEFFADYYPPDITYADFANQFQATFFQPDQWASVFSNSGAKYGWFGAAFHFKRHHVYSTDILFWPANIMKDSLYGRQSTPLIGMPWMWDRIGIWLEIWPLLSETIRTCTSACTTLYMSGFIRFICRTKQMAIKRDSSLR